MKYLKCYRRSKYVVSYLTCAILFCSSSGLGAPAASSLQQEALLRKNKPLEITVKEPHDGSRRTYVAFAGRDILTQVLGHGWQSADEVLFKCADGYVSSIPVQRFLEHKAFLAYRLKANNVFSVTNKLQGNEEINLGPYYLIWDNLNDQAVLDDGATYWPYQIVSIESVKFSMQFPKIIPPLSSGADVKHGFLMYRKHCMSCHSINGEGGGVSHIDLNTPVNVTEYFKEPWLEKWIANPVAMRPKTTMPPLLVNEKDKNQIIKDIIAYLKAMKTK